MAKVNSHTDLDTSYVRVSKLPSAMRASISQESISALKDVDGETVEAIEYSQYEYWFDFQCPSNELDSEV